MWSVAAIAHPATPGETEESLKQQMGELQREKTENEKSILLQQRQLATEKSLWDAARKEMMALHIEYELKKSAVGAPRPQILEDLTTYEEIVHRVKN